MAGGLLIGLILGLVLGLVAGWMTVSFKASSDDVAAAADSYYLNENLDLAKSRLSTLSKEERDRILNDLIAKATASGRTIEAQRLTKLAQALGSAGTPGATPAPGATPPRPSATPSAGLLDTLGGLIIPIVLVGLALLIVAAAGLIFVLRVLPRMQSRREPGEMAEGATETVPQWGARPAVAPPPTTAPGGLGRFIPQYTLGNDNYDTSYSLETPRGEFLGECGMGISETIGEGKPDKVTAFDLWLFDKADVRTVTQILMSQYAYNDQGLRTKLASKGEAVLAERGKTIRLETQSLGVTAQVVELVYAANPSYPPNSHFQKLIVEIVPTIKDGAAR